MTDTTGALGAVDRILLIRHGQTTANVARILDTALPGAPLTDKGVTQARSLGRLLLPRSAEIGDLVTSHALRARQTGACAVAGLHRLAGPGVRLRHLDGLQEVSAGDFEGRNDMDAHRGFLEIFQAWLAGAPGRRVPGGETADEVIDRWLTALATAAEGRDGGTLAVVGHGAAIRLVAHRLAGLDPLFVMANPVPNTGRIELIRDGDGWRVIAWGGRGREAGLPGQA